MSWGMVAVAGASVVGGYLSSKGAKDAAKAQAQGSDRAADVQWDMFNQARADNEPWRQAGLIALPELLALNGLSSSSVTSAANASASAANPTWFGDNGARDDMAYYNDPNYRNAWDTVARFHNYDPNNAFTRKGEDRNKIAAHMQSVYNQSLQKAQPKSGSAQGTSLTQAQAFDRFRSTPGYQFGLTEGVRALDSSAAAAGGLFSGKAAKELTKFGQNYADQQGFTPYYNRLASLAGIGQTATAQNNSLGQAAGANIGQAYQGAGNARASGIAGSANAWGSALGQGAGIAGYMYGNGWGNRNSYANNPGYLGPVTRQPINIRRTTEDEMAQIETPDILGNFLAGQKAGQEQRRRKTLSDFLQPALSGDQNALSQVYAADPDAGLQVQGLAQRQQAADHDQKMGELEMVSRAWQSMPQMRQQLYPTVVALTEAVMPQFAGKIPREYNPQFEANIDKFLAGFAPVEDNTPSAIRELQMLQANPELAELDMRRRTAGFDRPQLIQTDQGYAWATPQGATPLNYGGQQDAAPGLDQNAIQRNLAMLGARPGVQMTSGLRTAERNAAVGGKPNSQHLRGTAGDYVVPQAQRSQFMADAQAQGLQAIDEGDHVHVQAPRGSRVMPAKKAEKGSELEQRLALADQLGATPEEKRRMVIGGDTGRDAQRISAKDATTARQKITQIQAARNQLNAVKEQFAKNLRGSYSAGPLADYLPTSQGQAFDRAVRNLAPLVTAVTRVPGVGAMSDYESKLQEATLPSRGTYESVTEQQIADLERLLDTVEGGYRDLLGEGTQSPAAGASSNGWSIKVKP